MSSRAFESATDVAVVDGERLLGLVPIEVLLAAPAGVTARELMRTVTAVGEEVDQEMAAAQAARTGARTVAVVDGQDRFLGLVPAERLLAVLEQEHEEDLARVGGSLAALEASEEAVRRRLWHRLPWLALGLAGAMSSTVIVASFEEQLRSEVLLAFFVPAVVYMADAVGTQTETVVIRGMSLGVPIGRVAGRELATGLIIGSLVAVAFFPFALAAWGNLRLGVVVSLALLVSSSIATVVAMALPYLLARLGKDPAFGSGPLATVIQDLLSIAVYFAIALALLP
jgi:magnesium transporter